MSIFRYTDYRPFLKNYIDHLPKKGRGEILRMAEYAGVHPSILSQVLSGTKNLNLEQAQIIAEYINLTTPEAEHFFLMVQYQRAGSVKLQQYFKDKLYQSQQASIEISKHVRQDRHLSDEEKSVFYSHWLYVSTWLCTSLNEKGKTLDEISNWLEIPRERAAEILLFLTQTNLCILENGRYRMGPQSIHIARGSTHLLRHHTNWRLRAIEAADKLGADELMFTSPMSISVEDFKKIRSKFADLIKEVTEIAIQSPAQNIVCFNLDFFWIKKD